MASVKDTSPEMNIDLNIAVVAITRGGALLGNRLCNNMAGLEFYVSRRYAGQAGSSCHHFEPAELKAQITSLWKKYDGFVLIMATGIVVRMIAPLLESKETDPAVVVMDDAGRFAISLLAGHLGGANELAERCAFATGARSVITTATDANDLPPSTCWPRNRGGSLMISAGSRLSTVCCSITKRLPSLTRPGRPAAGCMAGASHLLRNLYRGRQQHGTRFFVRHQSSSATTDHPGTIADPAPPQPGARHRLQSRHTG